MSYRSIPSSLYDIGKATTQVLLFRVRNNFRSHETRLQEFEATSPSLPVGFITAYAGAAAPTGYLLCDGSAVSRATYANLFAILGITFNTGGEASTDFRLPDFRGRIPVGSGTGLAADLVTPLTEREVGDLDGAQTHALVTAETPSHAHSFSTTPTHSHTGVYTLSGGAAATFHISANKTASVGTVYTTDPAVTGLTLNNAGSGTAHNNVGPSAVVNFIVKT